MPHSWACRRHSSSKNSFVGPARDDTMRNDADQGQKNEQRRRRRDRRVDVVLDADPDFSGQRQHTPADHEQIDD
jgi:hypothetical protein